MNEPHHGSDRRWDRVKDIVADALDLEGAARARYLEDACGGDDDLRREVDALLASFEGAGEFLDDDANALDLLPDALHGVTFSVGDEIDGYEIETKLGEGGFSTVYGALQREPIERRVAIKLIKPGMDSQQIVQRFEAERVALARMDHPHIARVLDAGTTSAGHPYFVMDWVDGEPFTSYCDRERLELDARLDLFLQVCAAVQHAHTKGVVHRDLKPSNVLVSEVDGQPNVQVIDFGIAKALGEDERGQTMLTQSGMFLGTPEYMSPEQAGAGGGDIDKRADVYSLGVLLYETLTGTRPFAHANLRRAAIDEVVRHIREVDPPRPSTRIEPTTALAAESRSTRPKELARSLRGDLDWIVMKSLEKDRERRYSSVSGFAEDVQRHLDDEPVLAGPPSVSYRVKKFARRNRALFAAATLGLVAIIASAVLAGVGFYRASVDRDAAQLAQKNEKDAREKAEASLVEANKVADFLAAMFGSISPFEKGKDLRVYDLLKTADFRDLEDYPLVEARLRDLVGGSYVDLGEYRDAKVHLDRSLAIARHELGDRDARTIQLEVKLANLRYDETKQSDDGEVLQKLIARASDALGPEDEVTLNAKAAYAGFLFDERRLDKAIPLMREVLDANAERWRANRMRGNLAIALVQAREFEEAEKQAEQNLAEHLEVYGPRNLRTLSAQRVRGVVVLQQQKWAEAAKLFEKICRRHEEVLSAEHPDTIGVISYLALALHKGGKHDEAGPIYRRNVELHEKVLGPGHRQTMMCLHNYGMMLFDAKKYEPSEKILRDAFARYVEHRGEAHFETANARFHLADLLCTVGKTEEGLPLLENSIRFLVRSSNWKHPKTREAAYAFSRHIRPVVDRQMKAKDKAVLDSLKKVWNISKRLGDQKEIRGVARALTHAHEMFGNADEAAKWRRRAQ